MDRRTFIKGCAAGALYEWSGAGFSALAGEYDLTMRRAGKAILSPENRLPGTYSFLMFGDMHFDKLPYSTYHSAILADHPERMDYFNGTGYGENWAEGGRMERLLAAARMARRPDTAFALQLGDLCQGYRSDLTMDGDAFATVKSALGGDLSLRLVAGNHECINSTTYCYPPLKPADYRAWLAARMTEEIGTDISSSNFWYRQGPDLWIHCDFTASDATILDNVNAALAANANARYKFVITHGPAIPTDSKWYYQPLCMDSAANRRTLRGILLANDVIVFGGHVHMTELEECVTDEGRITQVVASSVFGKEAQGTYAPKWSDPSRFGDNGTDAERLAVLNEYKPALVRYIYADTAGFFRVEVSPQGVVARLFPGSATTPTANWIVR